MEKQKVISHFGGIAKLANLLGISRQAIHRWPDEIPALRQLQIERLSDGAFEADSKHKPEHPQ